MAGAFQAKKDDGESSFSESASSSCFVQIVTNPIAGVLHLGHIEAFAEAGIVVARVFGLLPEFYRRIDSIDLVCGFDLAADALVYAPPVDEWIEDQHSWLRPGDGLIELRLFGFEIEPQAGRGDDLDVDVGVRRPQRVVRGFRS
jgi:hypothetical protein